MSKRLDDKQLAAAAVALRQLKKQHETHTAEAAKIWKRIEDLKTTLRNELGDGIPF